MHLRENGGQTSELRLILMMCVDFNLEKEVSIDDISISFPGGPEKSMHPKDFYYIHMLSKRGRSKEKGIVNIMHRRHKVQLL